MAMFTGAESFMGKSRVEMTPQEKILHNKWCKEKTKNNRAAGIPKGEAPAFQPAKVKGPASTPKAKVKGPAQTPKQPKVIKPPGQPGSKKKKKKAGGVPGVQNSDVPAIDVTLDDGEFPCPPELAKPRAEMTAEEKIAHNRYCKDRAQYKNNKKKIELAAMGFDPDTSGGLAGQPQAAKKKKKANPATQGKGKGKGGKAMLGGKGGGGNAKGGAAYTEQDMTKMMMNMIMMMGGGGGKGW